MKARPEPVRPVARTHIGARALAPLLGEWDAVEPAYAALALRLKLLIVDGRIPSHTRLPSERELATALGRSRTTVVSAYRELREAGYLVSIRGSGSIATLASPAGRDHVLAEVDFARAAPAPVAELGSVLTRALQNTPDLLQHSGIDLLGDETLRARIADSYTRRGAPTGPEQIMVTLGAQHAIALVARTLLGPGDQALVEAPTYPHALQALRDAGARVVATPVTPLGWDIDHALGAIDRLRPTLAYLIPDFHNPAGAAMPDDQRVSLIHTARRAGSVLLIDETTADLDIDARNGALAFAAHATELAAASVITVGSLSKTVWGGLRIGWIRADPATLARLVARRPSGDLGTPLLEQHVASAVLDSYETLLEARLTKLRAQRDLTVRLLRNQLPTWQIPDVGGGLCLWVGLGAPVSSRLAAACQRQGLRISAGPTFGVDGAHERFIRVPFTAEPDQLRSGVTILHHTWQTMHDSNYGALPQAL